MFACLYLPPRAEGASLVAAQAALVQLARDFSPRVEPYDERTVALDISGLNSLLGDAQAIGDELRRTAADRGLRLHIAIASTTTTAILLAHARAGLTVIPDGEGARALAPLPLTLLETYEALSRRSLMADRQSPIDDGRSPIADLRRWGLRTLGDLAALPAADLSARLGQDGLRWQKWARGEDGRP